MMANLSTGRCGTFWLATRAARLLLAAVVLLAGAASADEPKLELPGQLGLGGFGDVGNEAEVTYTARWEAQNGGPGGQLIVTAKIIPGWHVYSVSQKKGGPQGTKFRLLSEPPLTVTGEFRPDKAPVAHRYEDIWPGLDVEEHEGTVNWRAAATLPAGVDPATFDLKLKVTGQVCSTEKGCVQINQTIPVKLTGFTPGSTQGTGVSSEGPPTGDAPPTAKPSSTPKKEVPFAAGPYRGKLSHVAWNGAVRWKTSGGQTNYELVIQAGIDKSWHLYPYATSTVTDVGQGKPTLIVASSATGWQLETPKSADVLIKKELSGLPPAIYYEGQVEWRAPLIPIAAASQEMRGYLGFQTCCDTGCDLPSGAEFAVALPDPTQNPQGELALTFRPASYKTAEAALAGKAPVTPSRGGDATAPSAGATSARKWEVIQAGDEEAMTLWSALTLAFFGGFLLNFMPCVLPVIGLKIVAFIQQSQGSRKQAMLLNLYYSLGLISVFMVLAAFAAVPQLLGREGQLGWGEQFQSSTFNTIMAALVFVFALSMLGVWEIPVPSFLGSGETASKREGYSAAFAKGVFTTVMATPCTGPFMGSALTWSFSQKAPIIFATFLALGLGMALPYLVIGAFPQMMKFLPKPGAWMDTFKQVMGFVLLATVVFIFSFMKKDLVVACVGMLVGLGLACWWIGRTPIYAETSEKIRAWLVATIMAVAVGWLSFTYLVPGKALLPWENYSRSNLERYLDEGRTVMVDFTADWCLTCKLNEQVALNTNQTLGVVVENHVAVIKADKTEDDETSDAINQLLVDLGHPDLSIPFLVIFPGDGSKPIAFSGPVTPSMVAKALKSAGPSKSTGKSVAQAP